MTEATKDAAAEDQHQSSTSDESGTVWLAAETRIETGLRARFTPGSLTDFLEEIADHLGWESPQVRLRAALRASLPSGPPKGAELLTFAELFDFAGGPLQMSQRYTLSADFKPLSRELIEVFLEAARLGRDVRSLQVEMRDAQETLRMEVVLGGLDGVASHGLKVLFHWQLHPLERWAIKRSMRRHLRWAVTQRALVAASWASVIVGLFLLAYKVGHLEHGVTPWWSAVEDYWSLTRSGAKTEDVLPLLAKVAIPPFAILGALRLWRSLPFRVAHFGRSRVVVEPHRVRLALPRIWAWLVGQRKIVGHRDIKLGLVIAVIIVGGWLVASIFSDTAPGNVVGIAGIVMAVLAWLRPRNPDR